MHARLSRMYRGTATSTRIVAIRAKAVYGVYWSPSHRLTPIVMSSWAHRPMYGDPDRLVSSANELGSSRMRPSAYRVRVEELFAAFWLAMTELSRARNTITNPAASQASRARTFCHGLLLPAPTKPSIRLGAEKAWPAAVL